MVFDFRLEVYSYYLVRQDHPVILRMHKIEIQNKQKETI